MTQVPTTTAGQLRVLAVRIGNMIDAGEFHRGSLATLARMRGTQLELETMAPRVEWEIAQAVADALQCERARRARRPLLARIFGRVA